METVDFFLMKTAMTIQEERDTPVVLEAVTRAICRTFNGEMILTPQSKSPSLPVGKAAGITAVFGQEAWSEV